jgi:diguanylate cyclase (GGDEF)-like protein
MQKQPLDNHAFSQMLQNMRDLEIELTTAIEHGDAIEQQLDMLNQQLISEIRQREETEKQLQSILELARQQKEDLEILVQSLAEHGDEVDMRWMARYEDIEQLARLDGLTQIGNRRLFNEYLAQELARCHREAQPLSLIFCDIDHFKRFNDSLGHWEGDSALIKVAQALKSVCKRPADKPMRYGGEEFAIILPNTNLSGAETIAGELQQAMMTAEIPHTSSPFGLLTLSIGVACARPGENLSSKMLVEQADDHLYTAKNQGRNRIVSDSHTAPSTETPSRP